MTYEPMQPHYESAHHEPAATYAEENTPSLLSAIGSMAEDIQAVKDDVSDIKGNIEFLVGRKRRNPSANRPTTKK